MSKKKKSPPAPTIGLGGVRNFTTEMLLESFHRPLWRDIAATAAEQTAEAARKLREGRQLVAAPEPEHPTREELEAAGIW